MNPIRVTSWSELQECLFADAWSESLGRFRSQCAFRGMSDARYQLDTSLMRLGGSYDALEHHLLRNFKRYAHRDVVVRDSVWHWLSVAQHHGLPTRLLDWTHSPLIAAHFATSNLERFDTDGAIWVVDYVQTHQLLPEKLRAALHAEGANVFTVDLLSHAVASLDELATLAEQPFPLFCEPHSIDDRIVNQYALFSVMSDPCARLDAWLEAHPHLWRKVVIPAEIKWEIRDKLDQSNITERVLFPGLDGLSSWLRRHYTPRAHVPPAAPLRGAAPNGAPNEADVPPQP